MKALVVDRDPLRRRAAGCMAGALGVTCDIVSSGVEALAALRSVAVVILDPTVDDIDAPDLVREIRARLPEVTVYGCPEPGQLSGLEGYDRVFFRPNGLDAALRAARGVIGPEPENDLLRTAHSGVEYAA